jgi:hypothetical protein
MAWPDMPPVTPLLLLVYGGAQVVAPEGGAEAKLPFVDAGVAVNSAVPALSIDGRPTAEVGGS